MNSKQNLTLINSFTKQSEDKNRLILFIIPTVITLFFIEALRAYIPGIYIQMFHVVFQDEGWIASLFSLLTMGLFTIPLFTKMLSKSIKPKRVIYLSIIIISICRLLMAIRISAIMETILSGLVVGFYGMFVGAFIGFISTHNSDSSKLGKIGLYTVSFITAILIDFIIRMIGFTIDPTLITWPVDAAVWFNYQYNWVIIQVIISTVIIVVSLMYWKKCTANYIKIEVDEEKERKGKNLFALIAGLGLGVFLFLSFNILLYGNAVAEFTNTDYFTINILLVGIITLTTFILLGLKENMITDLKLVIPINILFPVGFFFLAYAGNLGYISGIMISLAYIPLILDLYVFLKFAGIRGRKGNKIRMYSNIFAIAFGIFLFFSFFYDFTTDWSFTIKAMRNLGPPILIIASIIFILTAIIATYLIKSRRVEQ